MTDRHARLADLKRFYASLARLEKTLGGVRRLSECSGRMSWPRCGIYFFMETSEVRTDTGKGFRIVRVGTHALKAGARTRLWTRLAQHKGSARSGGGNHRGSIFREIVGSALIKKHSFDCPSWVGVRRRTVPRAVKKHEQPLEQAVSMVIGVMPFLWLAIEDEPGPDSDRGYVERNAIALLSNLDKHPIDPSSRSWLGRKCDRERVRASGLWNSNHIDEVYDPAFLGTLDRLIDQMGHHA